MSVLVDPAAGAAAAIPVVLVTASTWREAADRLASGGAAFAAACGFEGTGARVQAIPGGSGIAGYLFPEDANEPFQMGRLPGLLPAGLYRLEGVAADAAERAALAFALGAYRFDRYKAKQVAERPRLVLPAGVDGAAVRRIVDGVSLGRDLINTPASDLGPAELEQAVRALANPHRAAVKVTTGDDLLAADFPMIHAVGRASVRAPRLIDMSWGESWHPKVTLVGKGVCFDTGGLNLKTDAGMLLMKKDMGGAATMLALAQMIMEAKLSVRLRVLIPAVENAVSGSSFRPGDVLRSRKGLTVEIGNTDAEGRLILGDALALADEEAPDLLVDAATLTGAARVALGPDLPPVYTDDEALAADILACGDAVNDPVWRMPLWRRYQSMLDSKVADINHVSGGAFAGSVTAALFLRRFVEKTTAYAHFDIFGWVPAARPGRPEGGEPQAARLLFELISRRFASRA